MIDEILKRIKEGYYNDPDPEAVVEKLRWDLAKALNKESDALEPEVFQLALDFELPLEKIAMLYVRFYKILDGDDQSFIDSCDLWLGSCEHLPNKIMAIKAVRQITNLGLKEARDIVDSRKGTLLLKEISFDECQDWIARYGSGTFENLPLYESRTPRK